MNKSKHIEDSDIISYVNNISLTNANNELNLVKKHIDNCSECQNKIKVIKEINSLIDFDVSSNNVFNDNISLCPKSDKIDNFLENKLLPLERKSFYLHLYECDECRSIVSALIKSNPYLLNNNYMNGSCQEPIWEKLNNGVIVIKGLLNSFICGTYTSQVDHNFKSQRIVYRGYENSDALREYQEIELPENEGIVSLKLFPYNDVFNLEIKIYNSKKTNRIDIYSNNTMLNSIDGNSLTFQIPDQEFQILINDKYEIC